MAHPRLKRTDVYTVPQVLSSKCVSKLVEEEVLAVRSLSALIAMLRNALSAIQFRTVSNPLHNRVILPVGIATFVGKHQLRRQRIADFL
jgi:hypothetical protein